MCLNFCRDWAFFYFGLNNTEAVSPAQQLDSSTEDSLAGKTKGQSTGAFPPLVEKISMVQLQEIAPRQLYSQVTSICVPRVYSQLGGSSCRRSLCALSDLLLLLALLLASVVGTLPHGQPPLRVRGRFGVTVFGQFAWKGDQKATWRDYSTQQSKLIA